MEKILREVREVLQQKQLSLVTAESCTGGWVAQSITSIPGSSVWFERGFVTYSNASKTEMLGVDADLILTHGAVSEQVAKAMAEGALAHSRAQLSLSITGVAGPDGGSDEKPVGTVWFGWAIENKPPVAEMRKFDGDREAVRRQAVEFSLGGLLSFLD